jgi:hypothetical protein
MPARQIAMLAITANRPKPTTQEIISFEVKLAAAAKRSARTAFVRSSSPATARLAAANAVA